MSVFTRGLKALTLNTLGRGDLQSWEIGNAARTFTDYMEVGWRSAGSIHDERTEVDFEVLIDKAYKANGVIFSCILARQLLFSQARFMWRNRVNGIPQDLYGARSLSLLERPWPAGTTQDLLNRAEVDASLSGNFYATTADDAGNVGRASLNGPNRRFARMRPDWVTIVVGVPGEEILRPWDLRARIIAFIYKPPAWATGSALGVDDGMEVLLPEEVLHYAPIPDPAARWRGMSWLTPVINEVESDIAATRHKKNFFKRGASPSLSVSVDKDISIEDFEEFQEKFNGKYGGADNAWKPYFLLGADVKPMTMSLRDLDFKVVQGAGETRIASAARVPAVIAGLSEGLETASYANYSAAKRHFADHWARPAWDNFGNSTLPILGPPPAENAELYYREEEIHFLREDQTDKAQIQSTEAATLNALITAGWTTESALAFMKSGGDWKLLKHSGMWSVQLQPPVDPNAPAPAAAPAKPPAAPKQNGHPFALDIPGMVNNGA